MKYIKVFETTEALNEFKIANEDILDILFYNKETNETSFGVEDFGYNIKLVRADGSYVITNGGSLPSIENKESFVKLYSNNGISSNKLNGFTNIEEIIFSNCLRKGKIISIMFHIINETKIKILDFSNIFTTRFTFSIGNQPELETIIFPKNCVLVKANNKIRNCPKINTIIFKDGVNLTRMDYSPFNDIHSLETIIFEGNTAIYNKEPLEAGATRSRNVPSYKCNIPSDFLTNCNIKNIQYPANLIGISSNGLITSGITVFPNIPTFKYCDFNIGSFETINIPDNFEWFSIHPFNVQGNTTIKISGNNPYYTTGSIDNSVEELNTLIEKGTGLVLKCCINSDISNPSYVDVFTLEKYSIHNIKELRNINLPSTIKQINNNNFILCPELTSVVIPATIPPILGSDCFVNVPKLESIYVPSNAVESYKAATNWSAVADKIKAMEDTILVTTNGNVNVSEFILTSENIRDVYEEVLTEATIGTVSKIESAAFNNCTKLTSINISDTVTYLGDSAFTNCHELTSVTLPNVRYIKKECFSNCDNLISVTIPQVLPPLIDNNIFKDTNADLKIYVPAEAVDTYKADTNWATYADKIFAIPESVNNETDDNNSNN